MATHILVDGVPLPEAEPLLTPREVAALFRVDPKTLVRWVNAGKLTAIRTPGGTRRFREAEVRALIDASREGADRTGGMRMTQIHLTAAHFVAASPTDPCRTAVALAVGEAVPGVMVADHGDALSYRLTEADPGVTVPLPRSVRELLATFRAGRETAVPVTFELLVPAGTEAQVTA